jgi:hypothetical protein
MASQDGQEPQQDTEVVSSVSLIFKSQAIFGFAIQNVFLLRKSLLEALNSLEEQGGQQKSEQTLFRYQHSVIKTLLICGCLVTTKGDDDETNTLGVIGHVIITIMTTLPPSTDDDGGVCVRYVALSHSHSHRLLVRRPRKSVGCTTKRLRCSALEAIRDVIDI